MLVFLPTLVPATTVRAPFTPGWARAHHVHPHTPVEFSVCLKQRNLPELFRSALDVSTPGNARYGQYLSVSNIEALTAPDPAHVAAVTAWLDDAGVVYTRQKECMQVSATARAAERLLSTRFALFRREVDGRTRVRAGDYMLPAHVEAAVDAVFGLHGVPLPPLSPTPTPNPTQPAAVTPTVLAATYKATSPPAVDRHGGVNKQAVAEFQGEYMRKSDLSTFFAAEVPTAQPGDENVSAFVGVPYKEGSGVEAALDIQFIMGVAPGVKTEFWEWPEMDFCADLLNYTSTLLTPNGPLVNSISYGWQGDLAQVGCHDPLVAKVDANWAKLAAAGISVFISSGDSGSQCTSSKCQSSTWKHGKKVIGGVVHRTENTRLDTCCEIADENDAVAFTWTPPDDEVAVGAARAHAARGARAAARAARLVEEAGDVASAPPPVHFDKSPYHVVISHDDDFPVRDVHVLDGTIGADAGSVSLHSLNGTFVDTTIDFGPMGAHDERRNVSLTMTVGGSTKTFTGHVMYFAPVHTYEEFVWESSSSAYGEAALLIHGPNPPPPPPEGNCTLYSTMGTLTPAANDTVSGGSAITPDHYVLYPSWPASSPWVTAVGATRFLNQTVGHEEMASDQFGSGGGFSTMWNQTSAPWQVAAVAKYVAMGPSLPKWPPTGSFPPHGRATPDVSALGEGYQVYEGGRVQSVGGTSASSPAFAGYVSLINEARLKAGKPQMGFINPFLYQNPHAFFDVTKGTNAIGRGTGSLKYGYAAAPGWDAATGLGTPLFDALLQAAMA